MDPKLIKLIRINQSEYKKLPQFTLTYGILKTKFGNCLAAIHNQRYLCYLTFYNERPPKLEKLMKIYPKSKLIENHEEIKEILTKYLTNTINETVEIYLKGTPFEMNVWQTLLQIQPGETISYEGVAKLMNHPKATRAVARAIAKNHINWFVPCHRVIAKNGALHRYESGPFRKALMLRDEGLLQYK